MRNKRPESDRPNETYNQVSEQLARKSKGGLRQIPLGAIKPNPHNARTHSAKQIRQIANSMAAFGFTNPLLVSEDHEVIAGHGRYEAAKLLGLKNAPVIIVPGLSPARRRALAIADNKIAENAGWNRERLAIEIPELTELLSVEGLDISILGFEPPEIDQVRLESEEPAAGSDDGARSHNDIDAAWGSTAAVSLPGDLWILGRHKLLCGEGRPAADLERLMGDDRADMAFIDSLADMRTGAARGGLGGALEAAAAVSREGAVHFVCTGWEGACDLAATVKNSGRRLLDVVVWVKSAPSKGLYIAINTNSSASFRLARPSASARRRRAAADALDRTYGATRVPRRSPPVFRNRFAHARGSSQSGWSPTRSKTARVATTSSLTRFAAPGPRSWQRSSSVGARAASNANRSSSTSRSVAGRPLRVGKRFTPRAGRPSKKSPSTAPKKSHGENHEPEKARKRARNWAR
jgi:hypothetical protein